MQGAAGRGPRQLFARDQRAKPFKAKTRGPVFGGPDPIPLRPRANAPYAWTPGDMS